MKLSFINLKSQYQKYGAEIQKELLAVMDATAFIQGPYVKSLEQSLSDFTGAKHSIACSSGTDALLLALLAIDFKAGDEVITTPFTFVSTAEVIHLLGGKAVFVDIEKDTYNMDATLIEAKITSKTRAIMPVSLFGQTADMDLINAIAEKHRLVVIEDSAQSFGAKYKGKRSCNLSTLACTSFYPAKPLGCYGDGGAVFTGRDDWNVKIRSILNHGQVRQYIYEHVGVNGRLDGMQAAVLNVKLKYFEHEITEREKRAKRYQEALSGKSIVLPTLRPERSSVYAQYSVRVKNRDEFQKKLAEAGVPTAIYYPVPLHQQKPYLQTGNFSVTDQVAREIISLPFCAFLSEQDQAFVCEQVIKIL